MELDVIKGITKYINTMFSPDRISIDSLGDGKYIINVIYNQISDEMMDKYWGPNYTKETSGLGISRAHMLRHMIALQVYKFWGVLSYGISTQEDPYYENSDLRINVYIKK